MAAMASCSMEQEPATVETNKVSATADDFKCDEAFTRTTITQSSSSAPTFAWKAGDVIGVIPMDGKTVQSNYEISKIDTDPKSATFDGGVWALKEGKGYAAYYPYNEKVARSGDKLEFSFEGQTQTANNSLEHISAYDYMYAPAVTASSSTTAFNFSHLVSLVRVQITMPNADTFTKIILESTENWFAGSAELALSSGVLTAKESLKSATINLNNIEVAANGVLTVWFATLPTAALDGKTLSVKLFGNNATLQCELTGLKAFEAGKAYSYSCTAVSSASAVEYVDLGLSVKWATCNLGASAPEEYGDYYAWGEIETYYEDGYAQESPQKHWKEGKSNGYGTNSYKFYTREIAETDIYDNDGSLIQKAGRIAAGYTKYIMKEDSGYGLRGFYDDLTTLEKSDDIAHIKLGGKWRMPTDAEMTELINNCTCQWAIYKGVNGYKVTSNKAGYTDKWIFLPAAGSYYDTSLNGVGSGCYFWSSSLRTDLSYNAYYLVFTSYSFGMGSSGGRCFGLSVRPVTD